MPNRFLKESICTSPTIAKLTAEVECLFYRIMVQCDDYGRMESHPQIIRARCLPWKTDTIGNDQVEQWLRTLVAAELIVLYEVDDKRYLQVKTWEKHQQVRAKHSKFPSPNGHLIAFDNICNQPITDVLVNDNVYENENDNVYTSVFKCWNTQGIIIHQKLTSDMRSAIKGILKDYSEEQIRIAIENYACIVKGDEYFFKHKWTLADFLSRRKGNNIERFLDLEIAKQNFRDGERQKHGTDQKPGRGYQDRVPERQPTVEEIFES